MHEYIPMLPAGMTYNWHMKLLIGLGNPGIPYQHNRHNAGALYIDFLYEQLTSRKFQNNVVDTIGEWKTDSYTQSLISSLSINGIDFIFAKPQTFMNASGISVAALVKRFHIKIESDLIVAHDELDIPLGKYKIQRGVGPKLHNGISSIENHIKTNDFVRIRIGIDNRLGMPIPGETYVLHDFTKDEIHTLRAVFAELQTQIYSKNRY